MTLCLRDYSLTQLEKLVGQFDSGPNRARTLFSALAKCDVEEARHLTKVAKPLRIALDREGFYVSPLTIHQVCISRSDPGTVKFLFLTHDGLPVESVLMPAMGERTTLCVSSQVGCKMGCSFCCTAQLGFIRNLSRGEIVTQLTKAQSFALKSALAPVTNIVFMGMGEPFDNFDNVMAAFDTFNHALAYGISRDRITISTVGHVDGIDALAKRSIRTNVALSLNAPSDELRDELMPINKKWPLKDVIAALERYPLRPGRVFVIEYVLIKGVNDRPEHARGLIEVLSSLPCKVNVIRYNPSPSLPYEAPSSEEVSRFASLLENISKGVLVRRSRGADIAAACGQLGRSRAKE